MSYAEGLSASDVALLSNSGRNNDGWGNEGGAWWIIIFLIFALDGFGNNGWRNRGNQGAADNYVLASDFATLQRQLDSGFDRIGNRIENVNNGLCDGFYAMNTGMLNGFGGIQQALCQGFSGVNTAITQNGYETRLGVQELNSQLANCCCDIRQQISDSSCATQRSIDAVNYNMAMNTNSLQNAMCNNTRDIIESNNANYRALHDELVANRLEDKNAQIQAQQNEINALRLAASQASQTNELISTLRPCPVPSYQTCNPWATSGYGGCGYNMGCGCN